MKHHPIDDHGGRYEFRVWGQYPRAARVLDDIADSSSRERIHDCYLLVDDPAWNAKIRGNSIKIKQLVTEQKGFEHWVSQRHRAAESAPSPFDELFGDLNVEQLAGASAHELSKLTRRIDPDSGIRAVVVTKDRRRHSIGEMRAEYTRIAVHETGERLRTLVIEGDDLDELKALRKELGIRGENNIAVHHALAAELAR